MTETLEVKRDENGAPMTGTYRIKVYVTIGLVGCRREVELDIEDDMTDDEIEELARDTMFEIIEWGWKRVEESE